MGDVGAVARRGLGRQKAIRTALHQAPFDATGGDHAAKTRIFFKQNPEVLLLKQSPAIVP